MEIKKASPSQPALKWALINLITSIVITYAFQFLDIDPNSSLKYLSFLPFLAFMFLAQKEYKDQLGGYVTYGEGFLSGFLYAIFTGVFIAIFTYVYYAILSPEMVDKIIDASQKKMTEDGKLSQDQIDAALNMTRKYFAAFAVVGVVFMYAIFGTIVSLISAAVFKNERSPFDTPDNYEAPKPTDPAV
ncbi:DUF4199 domain-containing protein [Mucilaginibacter sp. SMC90]|uniref:DUF4199 domain-containing protein n=1 Tax=Mucilaginibacter sp. SMC90 TaxID=2929803 RepID=UPI001FB3A83A|nr:DUF4199 domain-containing protein [Mucilaginibacter sp. SMC90]UOE52720.1 DUF4199 domain-containing protein [Mucilaginibacter sp. SMC90]